MHVHLMQAYETPAQVPRRSQSRAWQTDHDPSGESHPIPFALPTTFPPSNTTRRMDAEHLAIEHLAFEQMAAGHWLLCIWIEHLTAERLALEHLRVGGHRLSSIPWLCPANTFVHFRNSLHCRCCCCRCRRRRCFCATVNTLDLYRPQSPRP